MTVPAVAERLCYDSAELEFAATVTDIRLNSTVTAESGDQQQLWQVALDRTAFYPAGGGQPWDTGMLIATARSGAKLEVPVERVEEDNAGEVWHFVRKPLVQGTEVVGRVDSARRIDHAQQHSGQHLLSAVFLRELGARTVSFHLGEESSTIDLQLRDLQLRDLQSPSEDAQPLSDEQLRRVEYLVNVVIFEDHALRPGWVSREEAEAMLARGDLRKLPERTGPMRIVEMSGIEFNACGGTHVASTGAIGGLLLRRLEKVRGGPRVEFVCGLRAVRAAAADFASLRSVAGALSVGPAEVSERVSLLLKETKSAAKERRSLLAELAEAKAVALLAEAPEGLVVHAIFAGKDIDFAKQVAAKISRAGRAAVIGVTSGVSTGAAGAIALARGAGSGVHAGNLLRGAFAAAGARGGGSGELAQGICPAEGVASLVAQLAAALAGAESQD